MTTFAIHTSDFSYGPYVAASQDSALEMFAAECGFASFAEMSAAGGVTSDELLAEYAVEAA